MPALDEASFSVNARIIAQATAFRLRAAALLAAEVEALPSFGPVLRADADWYILQALALECSL